MYQLASTFSRTARIVNKGAPMGDDEIRRIAPSIFAEEAHGSRSARYTYIATSEVLKGLRQHGFEPFMVAQTRVRDESHRDHTKHMIRLRHADHVGDKEANEIILLNSHNGSSSYQMLAGVFRFACANGMVCGTTHHDIRVPHKGDVLDQVIEGAHTILDGFDLITERKETMQSVTLAPPEQLALARAALSLRYDPTTAEAPISADQLLRARRIEDQGASLWNTFNRIQENMIKGGIQGARVNGRRRSTRAINGIDQSVAVNRGLWTLAEEMAKLHGAMRESGEAC